MTNSDGELISAVKSKCELCFQVDYFNIVMSPILSLNAEFCEFENGGTNIQRGFLDVLLNNVSIFFTFWLFRYSKRVLISVKVLKAIDKM